MTTLRELLTAQRQTLAAPIIAAVLHEHGGIEHTDQLAALIAAALEAESRLA